MLKRAITALALCFVLAPVSAYAGSAGNYPANVNSLPGGGFTLGDLICGDTIQGLVDCGFSYGAAAILHTLPGSSSAPGIGVGSPFDSGLFQGPSDSLCFSAGGGIRGCAIASGIASGWVFGSSAANTTPFSIGGAATGIENIGAGPMFGDFRQLHLGGGAVPSQFACATTRSSTLGVFSHLASGDQLCRIIFAGDDGSSYDQVGAEIRAVSKAAWIGIGPTDLLFNTQTLAGAPNQTFCLDGDTGLWINTTGLTTACAAGGGFNFLDPNDNASFATETLTGAASDATTSCVGTFKYGGAAHSSRYLCGQTTTGISTSPVTIFTTSVDGAFVKVVGSNGTQTFADLVEFDLNSFVVISSHAVDGTSPATRTYACSSGACTLTMSASTYTANTFGDIVGKR
jgi:hypothetical protein